MSIYRTLTIILAVLLVIGLAACNNANNANINLSENEAQKEEAFYQIMNNPELLNEFMNEMMQNSSSMHHMIENEAFMHHMLTGENLDYMMEHNHRFQDETMHYMIDHFRSDTSMHYDETMHDKEMMN